MPMPIGSNFQSVDFRSDVEDLDVSETSSSMIESAMTYRKRTLASMFDKADLETQSLLEGLLVFHPNKRLTVDQVLSHPYLDR
jgi:hypothetical protein